MANSALSEEGLYPSGFGDKLVGLVADLKVTIGGLRDELSRQDRERKQIYQAIRSIAEIPIPPITSTNGKSNFPDLAGPRRGMAWEVRRISVATFSAGTVDVLLDSDANPVPVFTAASAGTTYLSGGQLILENGHWLIFKANAITGNANISLGVIEIDQRWLGEYLL